MTIVLTGINFQYANGTNGAYTSVNLNFITNGGEGINLSGYVNVTADQYAANKDDDSKLIALIKQEVNDKLNGTAAQG